MIVGETKPISQLLEFVKGYEKILIVGCGGCVTVCFAGGEAEVKTLANVLKIGFLKEGRKAEVIEDCVLRQCEYEFADAIAEKAKQEGVDAILSLACGVGVNFLATKVGAIPVFPGTNTKFFGAAVEHGTWIEMCMGCGECILHLTGGICPIARCTKSLMNGPCGGTKDGKCEINPETDCGWVLIVNRMKELGMLDRLSEINPPRDWASSHHGGPRRVKKDLSLPAENSAASAEQQPSRSQG